jgi:outer membrane protein assembly factor BamB
VDPSTILALNPDGTLKWQYVDSSILPQADISVGADGTVYAQPYESGAVEAISSKGVLQWILKLPTLWPSYYFCSPTIGADGTIYVGGSSLFAIK